MTAVKRFVPLALLTAMGVIGALLVLTAGDDGPTLDSVTTVDGVVIDVPAGWLPNPEAPFRYEPPEADLSNVDSWTVAWSCGPDGCTARTLDEWWAIGERLETFTRARADEGTLLTDLVESEEGTALVLRARAVGGRTVVAVAVFNDGADRYLECDLSILGDPGGLDDAIVKACRSAAVPSPGGPG